MLACIQPRSLKVTVVHEPKYKCPSRCRTAAVRDLSCAGTRPNVLPYLDNQLNIFTSRRVRANMRNAHLRAPVDSDFVIVSSWMVSLI
jgi:hypothetical protein